MKSKLVIVIGVAILATSCAPIYIPSAPMVFNNQQAGDYQIAYRQGVRSSNLQIGYAATDNLNVGITGSAIYTQPTSVGNTLFDGTKGLEVNLVGGFYTTLDDDVFEVSVGAGPVFLEKPQGITDYFKLYIQPAFTINTNKKVHTDFSMITRFVGTSLVALDENQVLKNYKQGYFEPVLSLSIGNELKFTTQTGVSLGLSQNYFQQNSNLLLNFGLSYSLPKNHKKPTLP